MRSIHCPLSFFILCPDATSILNILMNGPLCFIYLFPSSSRQPAVKPSLTYKSKGGYGIFILLTVKAQTLGMLVVNLKECCVFSAWLWDLYVTDSPGSDPGMLIVNLREECCVFSAWGLTGQSQRQSTDKHNTTLFLGIYRSSVKRSSQQIKLPVRK